MQLLLISCIALLSATSSLAQSSTKAAKAITTDTLQHIILAYFQFHGVRSLSLIVCPSNSTGLQISKLAAFYMAHNMPLRIWSAENYLNEMPKRALFGPPITFREDKNDSYRRPLKLTIAPSTHKTGIVLNDFQSKCNR